MKLRVFFLSAVLVFALGGCSPEPLIPSPSPSADGPVATADPSSAASPSPTVPPLALPADCTLLVPLAVIQSEISPHFVHIVTGPDYGGAVAQDFLTRGGLACTWGIPQSGAGASVYVAERATPSDAAQVAQWVAAGYSECVRFLDECYYEEVSEDYGDYQTLFVLVEGYEIQVQSSAAPVHSLMIIARAAATSMGYV